jgi:hypothetical protein
LALEIAWLDELQEVFYARALDGDVQCGALVAKLISTRCSMLGIHTPQTAVLKIVEDAAPKETTTDRIERVSAELREQDRKNGYAPNDRPLVFLLGQDGTIMASGAGYPANSTMKPQAPIAIKSNIAGREACPQERVSTH